MGGEFHITKRKGAIRVVDMTNHFKIDKKTAMNWLKAWEEKGFVKRKSLAKKRYIEFILEENIRNNLMPVGK